MPEWITNRPQEPDYYIGIGYAEKSDPNYARSARDKALADIASEISVTINNQFTHSLMEKAGIVKEEVESMVKSSTAAKLEGYEQVDKWEDSDGYWVYYRLSRKKYAALMRKKRDKAISQALDFYSKALEDTKQGLIGNALNRDIQALAAIGDYWGEPLETDFQGKHIIVFNELYSFLQNTFSSLNLIALDGKRNGIIGKGILKPLEVKATFATNNGTMPAKKVPLIFRFVRGSGELIPNVYTDDTGLASSNLTKITGFDKLQIINVAPDMEKLAGNRLTEVQYKFLKTLTLPETRFLISVKGPSVAVEVQEKHITESNSGVLYIEPKLKNALTQLGFEFTKDMAGADYLIEITAAARQGANVYNMFTAFVDVNIAVTDMKTGQQIYKNVLSNLKGIQLSYDKADIKAYEAAGKKVEKLVPEIFKQK